jgi:hypothetical protein
MGTCWMAIHLLARGEVHQRVEAQTDSGPRMACATVDGVFVIAIGVEAGIEDVGAE